MLLEYSDRMKIMMMLGHVTCVNVFVGHGDVFVFHPRPRKAGKTPCALSINNTVKSSRCVMLNIMYLKYHKCSCIHMSRQCYY